MMTHAYDKMYLASAMNNLGEAFDFAVNGCKIPIETFMKLFIVTGIAKQFEIGNPKFVEGYSGTELAMEILSRSKVLNQFPLPLNDFEKSPEFWCGYIICYYQWNTNISFKEFNFYLSMNEVLSLYQTLHEATEEKFVDVVNLIIERKRKNTFLQLQRKRCGLTQKELSEKTGINLRTLQQYETRAKNLNNASVKTVYNLSKTLGCEIQDLLE